MIRMTIPNGISQDTIGSVPQSMIVEILDGPRKGEIGIFRSHSTGFKDRTVMFIPLSSFAEGVILPWETGVRVIDKLEVTIRD